MMSKIEVKIMLECENPLEISIATKNLQKLTDRLRGKGINKLMKMYEDPMKKIAVNGFFIANGI